MSQEYKSTRDMLSGNTSNGNSFADLVTLSACKMLEDGARARQTRFQEIKKNEDMYFGVNAPALKGRSNIPFDSVVMGGFIDNLQGNLQQDVDMKYGHTREQDALAADKVSAVLAKESGDDKGDWNSVWADSKFLASLAGVGILKLNVENTPYFCTDMTTVDHYDFVMEALGGKDLDKHMYKFQMNIFRTQADLTAAGNDGYYSKAQVARLIGQYTNAEMVKQMTDIYNNKQIRYATFGIDIASMGYVGQTMYRLVEGVVNYGGKWYYLVFSYETKTWVRFQPLEEVFSYAKDFKGRGPWDMWQTHSHPFIAWTKAVADDIRPVGYSMKKILNYSLDNLEKKNWGQRAYDPKMFTDPTQLLWKQDGLVRATVKPNQNIQNGIFEFQTPDTTSISINLIDWLNNFTGKKVGISSDAEGAPQSDRVGIVTANLEEVSKRFKLTNKRFKKSAINIATRFDYEVHDKLREDYAVKILGPKGVQWEETVTRKDTECDFSVSVKDPFEEEQKKTLAAQKRELAFQRIDKNPLLLEKLNKNKYIRTVLEDADMSQESIAEFMDINNDGDTHGSAVAAQAIADVLAGKKLFKLYRDAMPGFIEKILNYCAENYDLIPDAELAGLRKSQQMQYAKDMKEYDALMAYAEKHIPIAQKNMERKAVSVIAAMEANPVATEKIAPTTPALPGADPAAVIPTM